MKKTIKEEMNTKVFRRFMIGDNTLLLYKQNDCDKDQVDICIQYIENNSIKEQFLTTIDAHQSLNGVVDINHQGIAVFETTPAGFQLKRVYSIEEHAFATPDFMEIEYKRLFPKNELSPQMIKRRRSTNDKS